MDKPLRAANGFQSKFKIQSSLYPIGFEAFSCILFRIFVNSLLIKSEIVAGCVSSRRPIIIIIFVHIKLKKQNRREKERCPHFRFRHSIVLDFKSNDKHMELLMQLMNSQTRENPEPEQTISEIIFFSTGRYLKSIFVIIVCLLFDLFRSIVRSSDKEF